MTRTFLCGVLCAGLYGCGGGSDAPPYQTVHGRITLDEKPLESARVTFIPEKGPSSAAVTDADGNYTLLNRDGGKGAVEGKHKVAISTDLNGERTPKAERVPFKYNEQTTLDATVKKGDNTVDFALKTAG